MKLTHLQIESKIVPKYILLPGDPGRVDLIGEQLSKFKIINQNREFRVGIGTYKDIKILVCSTGIGCPSTAIAVEELIDAGASVLIRVGTCGGSWLKNINNGSFIIPSASVRDEGTTIEYIPEGFPAVADFEIVEALKKTSIKNNKDCYVGINRTHDAFYCSQNSITKWGKYLLDDKWKNYETPIISSDMECASLFVIASLKNVKAGAMLLVNADPEPLRDRLNCKKQKTITESSFKNTENNINDMIRVVLETIGVLDEK